MLDDTRCSLDASSLHRDTSMDISLSKNFRLLSCRLETSKNIHNIANKYAFILRFEIV